MRPGDPDSPMHRRDRQHRLLTVGSPNGHTLELTTKPATKICVDISRGLGRLGSLMMRCRSNFAFVACSIAIVVGCGTNGDGTQPHQPSDQNVSIDGLVKSVIGFDRGQVSLAVLGAQGARAIACMEAQGFVVDPDEFPTNEAPQLTGRVFGGNIDFLLAEVAVVQTENQPPSSLDPKTNAYSVAHKQCLSEAIETVRSPLGELDAWLAKQQEELGTSLNSDQTMLDATQQKNECIQALGYGSSDSTELSNEIVNEANSIVERFVAHELTLQKTRELLGPLKSREDAMEKPISECINDFDQALRSTSKLVCDEFASKNSEAIVERLRSVDLTEVAAYLPD